MSHDQNFKNLILDYPLEALRFFAAEEAGDVGADARILPVRQEQLKERLGERFRELDVPLLVEWPDGRREALLFVLEEESDPGRFSIYRLAHYCLDLADLLETERVVPVVIFLRGGGHRRELMLGGERHVYLSFTYLECALRVNIGTQYRLMPYACHGEATKSGRTWIPHHITQRGNRRQKVFFRDDDYRAYRAGTAWDCPWSSVHAHPSG